MPTLTARNKTELFVKPTKGWNTKAADANLGPEYAVIYDNVAVDKDGNTAKRNGHARVNVTAIANEAVALGWGEYTSAAGARQVLFNTDKGKIYKVNTDGSVTEVGTGLAVNKRCYFNNFMYDTIITNGSDTNRRYDGSTVGNLSTDANMPIFKDGLVQDGRFWGFGISTDVMRVTASSLRNATTATAWTVPVPLIATSPFNIQLESYIRKGDKILDLGVYQNKIAILCRQNIISWASDADATLNQMAGNYPIPGAIGSNTTVNFGNELVFWSKFGVKSLSTHIRSGELEPGDDISENIDNHLANRLKFIEDNSLQDFVSFVHYPGRSWIGINVPTNAAATTFEQIWYHYQFGAWFRWTGINTRSLFVDSTGVVYGSSPGYILRLDTGTSDNGEDIDTIWQTPFLYLGDGSRNKRVTWITYIVKNDTKAITFSRQLSYDFKATGGELYNDSFVCEAQGALWNKAIWNKSLWGGQGRTPKRVKTRGRGLAVQHMLRNKAKDQPFSVEYMRIEYLTGGITR